MSRTVRNSHDALRGLSNPFGYLRARRANARPKSIPPCSWVDRSTCRESLTVSRVIQRMKYQGIRKEDAIKKLMKKFKLEGYIALRLVDEEFECKTFRTPYWE